jgi:hypothetical protein
MFGDILGLIQRSARFGDKPASISQQITRAE